MANYYAFTKNGKPVLGSPLQGKKPRGGKSTPIITGVDCKAETEYGFSNSANSFEDTDSYEIYITAKRTEESRQFPIRIGWVYTGSRLTKEKFIKSVNAELDGVVEFKFEGDSLFIVKSYIGTIIGCGVNFVLD
jgi:hypothetical protein